MQAEDCGVQFTQADADVTLKPQCLLYFDIETPVLVLACSVQEWDSKIIYYISLSHKDIH